MTTDMDVLSEAGLVPERVTALEERLQREIDDGSLPSCQYALAKDGRVVASGTFGDATDETRYAIFSSTKGFVAAAFWLLLGEGRVKTSDLVADLLPGFGTNGKDAVTVEHVLLHTAGFPNAPMGSPNWRDHESRLRVYRDWRLDWEPGTAFMYHHSSAHWVLADIIVAVTGTDHRDFVRRRLIEPLGLENFALGIPAAQQQRLADMVYTGTEMTPDELEAAIGIREIPAPPGSLQELGEFALLLNETEVREVGIPGGGAFSTASDVALFYQALLNNDQGLWDAGILEDATSNVRNTFGDPLFRVPANRTIGMVIAGDDGKAHMRGFGKTQSPRAFGHNGAGGQIAYADPETGVSFCYLTNGHERHMIKQARRSVGIASRAGLVTMA